MDQADCILPRYMTLCVPFINNPPMFITAFVNCLQSLPNLHTLEIGPDNVWSDGRHHLTRVLKHAKLPQIKALILPSAAHLLLKSCINVEEVDWVATAVPPVSDEFLRSLAKIWKSQIKRVAIPLIFLGDPSRKRSSTS